MKPAKVWWIRVLLFERVIELILQCTLNPESRHWLTDTNHTLAQTRNPRTCDSDIATQCHDRRLQRTFWDPEIDCISQTWNGIQYGRPNWEIVEFAPKNIFCDGLEESDSPAHCIVSLPLSPLAPNTLHSEIETPRDVNGPGALAFL